MGHFFLPNYQLNNHRTNRVWFLVKQSLAICELKSVNVPFQHKYGCIRDKRSGVESYPYPVKEGQQYINPGRLFVQQPPTKGKGSRGSFKLLR